MDFDLNKTIEILERTPNVLATFLHGLSDDWIKHNEGQDTWSPYDVVGHLIHGERTDWVARLEIILSEGGDKNFVPFDRFAQFHESAGKSLHELLEEFAAVRAGNIAILRSKNIGAADLQKTGIHPSFGTVSLQNLLATWAVHDLDHISQVVRVMAKQYKQAVGPWVAYLRVLKDVAPGS